MTSNPIEASPRFYARVAGVLYLIIIVLGIFGEMYVRGGLIAAGDAEATARNIMNAELLWRLGSAGQIVMLICAIPLALIMYVLLRPANKSLAALAVFFNLVAIAIEALNNLQLFTVINILGGADYLNAFPPQQLNAIATLAIKTHASGYNISLLFFGFVCLAWGYVIFKSGIFPKIIGALLMICCACYVTNSFAWFIAPSFAKYLFPMALIPCFIAELSMCLYLLIKGIDVAKWRPMALSV